ncbi:hypothetical protein HYH03_015594 [Edaphochlamys debaryana]|uniref:Heterokaryon incompatibility domain-containing protein n=1 Tax=Edaphochlamys debaryana TaxID=47281 RepID=A0A836BR16_9CHLO|nr:hypothetical protein HYH03_015594 [Edaphochlamys debaryana]|eukprot:KAG2485710.1 hypothetical protein HYH03_015594 [Edaphochlamys debaryana]
MGSAASKAAVYPDNGVAYKANSESKEVQALRAEVAALKAQLAASESTVLAEVAALRAKLEGLPAASPADPGRAAAGPAGPAGGPGPGPGKAPASGQPNAGGSKVGVLPQQLADTSALQSALPAPLPLSSLPGVVQDLHGGMPPDLAAVPMRLMRIGAVLAWKGVKVFEEVAASECVELPYSAVPEAQWAQTAVLSWRWGAPKPYPQQPGFTPMLEPQFAEMCGVLRRMAAEGLEYVWIDWCCVPQYSASPMVEVLRSKVFYARARAMLVVPTFFPLAPEGIPRPLLSRTKQLLSQMQAGAGEQREPLAAAAAALDAVLAKGLMAGCEYFSRVWTLAERMARYGRGEQLCHWVSLEAWLGMLVDAVLRSGGDSAAPSLAIYRKILGGITIGSTNGGTNDKDGDEAGQLLAAVATPLAAALAAGSLVGAGAEDLPGRLAALLAAAARAWRAGRLEEAPSPVWLLGYLSEVHAGVYQAWADADRVWAVYSYFCWKKLDGPSALADAVQDLVRVSGAADAALLAVGSKLGFGPRRLAAIAGVVGLAGMAAEQTAAAEDLGRKLAEAARRGDAAAVESLLQEGASPDAVANPQDGSTPLHVAAGEGHVGAIEALLVGGASREAQQRHGQTALHVAASRGHVAAVQALLGAGADKDARDAALVTPLWLAAHGARLDAARALIAAGADVNAASKSGERALTQAVLSASRELVGALLGAGADRDAADSRGETALHWAAFGERMGPLEELLAAGARIEAANKDGETPLARAASANRLAAVRALLAAGASASAGGSTALHHAARGSGAEVIAALLAAAADKSAKDKDGLTPWDVADPEGVEGRRLLE